jgi:hypothetical protein
VGYFGDYSPTLAQFQALPSQSAALAAAVRRAALAQEQMSQVPSGKKIQFWKESGLPTLGQDMFGVYMQLLKWDPIAPQVRAAVFRDLATLPGVKSAGPMSDPLGRPGFGIAMASSQGQAGRRGGDPGGGPRPPVGAGSRSGGFLRRGDQRGLDQLRPGPAPALPPVQHGRRRPGLTWSSRFTPLAPRHLMARGQFLCRAVSPGLRAGPGLRGR